MPHWYLKAGVQGAISLLPQARRWNRLLQRHVTGRLRLTDPYALGKWSTALGHLELTGRTGRLPATVVELGTGWFPVVPIALSLTGVPRVWTIDSQALLADDQVVATLTTVRDLHRAGCIEIPDRGLRRLEQALADPVGDPYRRLSLVGVTALVGDARRLALPTGSVELIVSNETLEHIPRDVIADIFTRFSHVGRPGAMMSHRIDMADHYASFDRRLSPYHFLRYSDRRWRWFDNGLQHQNRLRLSDHRQLHRSTGWHVVREAEPVGDPDALAGSPIAPQFAHLDPADLATYGVWLISRLAAADPAPAPLDRHPEPVVSALSG
jgi:hypothetical protein